MSEINRCRRGKKSGKEVEGEREREARQPMGHGTWDMDGRWMDMGGGARTVKLRNWTSFQLCQAVCVSLSLTNNTAGKWAS